MLGKLLIQNYLRLMDNILNDGAQCIRKSQPGSEPCSGGGKSRPAEPERCEVGVHTQGQAQAMISVRHRVAPAVPGDSMASGTAALPSAARPLRRTFRGEPGQVPLARDFVRRYLAGRRCPAGAIQDILVCTTELAANAVLHSRSGLPGGHLAWKLLSAPGSGCM
jgi:hypothetical protein